MSIIVYWLDEDGIPSAKEFSSNELLKALKEAELYRKAGHRHVTISTELEGNVTLPGVSDILPEDYNWKKRRI